MPPDAKFAPYRLAPGESITPASPSSLTDASPVVAAVDALPRSHTEDALCEISVWKPGPGIAPCEDANGQPAGMGGPSRSCPSSRAQRLFVKTAVSHALKAGFRGILFDRPDSAHAAGLYGAGFCENCQAAFASHLSREYGDHFEPVDYPRLARTALAEAPGAVTFERLPFGRDFWRFRHEALEAAFSQDVRAAREASREAQRPFEVAVQFEAVGPSQLRSARLADAAVFPALVPEGGTGVGLFRLLRTVMGRRPAAVAPTKLSVAALGQLAAVAAALDIELAGQGPLTPPEVKDVRNLARILRAEGLSAAGCEPVTEVAVLYSSESDLWTAGRHLEAVLSVSEALARSHVQAPIVTRLADVPRDVPIVLADAAALPSHDAKEILRRLDTGTAILSFGPSAQVDETGRPYGGVLPTGKPSGTRVGLGTLVELPALSQLRGIEPPTKDLLDRGLVAILGRGRRAAGVVSRRPVLVVLTRTPSSVIAHLVALGSEKAQGVTLFLGVKVAGGVRRGRFMSEKGDDVRIPMNPSGHSISTVLPSFKGYAVLVLSS